jgi:hypothetical protein
MTGSQPVGALPRQFARVALADELRRDRKTFDVVLLEGFHTPQLLERLTPRSADESSSTHLGWICHSTILAVPPGESDGDRLAHLIARTFGPSIVSRCT